MQPPAWPSVRHARVPMPMKKTCFQTKLILISAFDFFIFLMCAGAVGAKTKKNMFLIFFQPHILLLCMVSRLWLVTSMTGPANSLRVASSTKWHDNPALHKSSSCEHRCSAGLHACCVKSSRIWFHTSCSSSSFDPMSLPVAVCISPTSHIRANSMTHTLFLPLYH